MLQLMCNNILPPGLGSLRVVRPSPLLLILRYLLTLLQLPATHADKALFTSHHHLASWGVFPMSDAAIDTESLVRLFTPKPLRTPSRVVCEVLGW